MLTLFVFVSDYIELDFERFWPDTLRKYAPLRKMTWLETLVSNGRSLNIVRKHP